MAAFSASDTHAPEKVFGRLHYYAISWTYSSQVIASWGHGDAHECCQPVRFGSKTELEAWLCAGPGPCDPGHRETVSLASLPCGWGRAEFVAEAAAWARWGHTD